jgi:hypothetical protein
MRNLRNSCAGVEEWKVRWWTEVAGVYFVRKVLRGRRVGWKGKVVERSMFVQS